jgi:hypothetical protein
MGSQGAAARASDQYTPRQRLAAMLARAELDPDGFGTEVKSNPAAALQQAGFSDAEAQGLLSQEREADPGAALMRGSCADTTCIISLCPSSCFATIPAIPGLCQGGGGGGGCGFFSLF